MLSNVFIIIIIILNLIVYNRFFTVQILSVLPENFQNLGGCRRHPSGSYAYVNPTMLNLLSRRFQSLGYTIHVCSIDMLILYLVFPVVTNGEVRRLQMDNSCLTIK